MTTLNKTYFFTLLSLLAYSATTHAQDSKVSATQLNDIAVESSYLNHQKPVNVKNISRTTATELRDVLADEPGIQIGGGTGGTAQWVTLRGMGEDHINVIVDNTSSDANVFHHQSRVSLDPSLVKIIAVEKGAGSASAGIGATAGTIRATTLTASDLLPEGRHFGMRLHGNYFTNNGFSGGLTAYGQVAGFDGLVTSNYVNDNDFYDANGDKVANSALKQFNYLVNLGYSFSPNHRLGFGYRHEYAFGDRGLRNEFIVPPKLKSRYLQSTHNFSYEGKDVGNIKNISFNGFFSKVVDKKTPLNPPKDPNKPDPRQGEVPFFANIFTAGGNLGLTHQVFDQLKLKYGANLRYVRTKPKDSGVNQYKTDAGVYLEGIADLEPITLTAGVRYDYFDLHALGGKTLAKGNINPSVGLIWDVVPSLSIRASYNVASRSPRLREAALSGNGSITLADDLEAEKTRNAEIGFDWNTGLLFASGSLFHSKTDHFNTLQNNILSSKGTLINHGHELSAGIQWQGFKARLSMAYNTPKLDGKFVDRVSSALPMGRHWVSDVSYRFDQSNLEIGWRGQYVASRSYDGEVVDRVTRQTSIRTTVRAGYTVHDLYANWHPLNGDFNLNVSVNNILNTEYRHHSQRASGNSQPGKGRDFRIGANYKF